MCLPKVTMYYVRILDKHPTYWSPQPSLPHPQSQGGPITHDVTCNSFSQPRWVRATTQSMGRMYNHSATGTTTLSFAPVNTASIKLAPHAQNIALSREAVERLSRIVPAAEDLPDLSSHEPDRDGSSERPTTFEALPANPDPFPAAVAAPDQTRRRGKPPSLPTEARIPAIDIGSDEPPDRVAERGHLSRTDDLEDEEHGEDARKGEGAEARVDEDGGHQHDDHGAVEDLPPRVDFHGGREGEDGEEAEDEDRDQAHLVDVEGEAEMQIPPVAAGWGQRGPGGKMQVLDYVPENRELAEKIADYPTQGILAREGLPGNVGVYWTQHDTTEGGVDPGCVDPTTALGLLGGEFEGAILGLREDAVDDLPWLNCGLRLLLGKRA
ncbi:hypothetical protein KC336_g90 [Hortaea werneckii]|nr:hypothetical protein KC336_g90 [Hortaea werneckii]